VTSDTRAHALGGQAATVRWMASYLLSMLRPFLLVLVVSAMLVAQAAPPAASNSSQTVPADQENAKKANDLINQMIDALGGRAYLGIQDISQEGRTYSLHHGQSEGAGILFWRFYKYPDKERVELTKKRDVIEIFRGNEGFETTYKGTRADDPKAVTDYIRRRQYSLDWVLRKWLNEPGIALFFEGATVAAQKDTQQVTIMNSRNEGVTLYIDTNTHLPVKKMFSWRDPTDKERNVEDEIYDNYRPVQGIMTPFSVTRFYNGEMSSQRFLHAVSYNKGLNDSLFETNITYDANRPAPK
jgi:hypothetical protein